MELTLRIADTGSDARCHWLRVEALDAAGNMVDADRFEFARAQKFVLLNPLPDPTSIPADYKPQLRGPVEANTFDYRTLGDIASRHFLRRQAAEGHVSGSAFERKAWARDKARAWQPNQIRAQKGAGRDNAPDLADRHVAMRGAEIVIDAPDLGGVLRPVNTPSGTVLTISVSYDERYSLLNLACMGAGEGSGYVGRGAGNDTNRFWMKFSLAALPASSYISTVDFKVNVSGLFSGGGSDFVDIIPYNTTGQDDVQADACATRYANSIVGTPYVDESTAFTSTGIKTFTLPLKACADIEAAKAAVGRFSMALNEASGAAGNGLTTLEALENVGTDEPKLVITYATTPIAWTIEADFNRDGAYETVLTTRIDEDSGGVVIDRGMDESGLYKVSELSFGVQNRDGQYTPEYSSASLAGQLRLGVPVRITASYGGSTYTMWTGYIRKQRNTFAGGVGERNRVEFFCSDLAAYLQNYTPLAVAASTIRDTDGALVAIMDAMGLAVGDRNFDDGVQDLQIHYVNADQAALEAMMDAVRSEMGGHFWITAGGLIRFEARNSRLGITVDDTWGDGTRVEPRSEEYEMVVDELVSQVSVQPVVVIGGAVRVVSNFSRGASHSNSISLVAGETRSILMHYDTPVTSLQAVTANTDYQSNDAIDGSGTDRTSTLTVTVTDRGTYAEALLKNTHTATVYVTKLQIRGTPQDLKIDRPIYTFTKTIPGEKAAAGVALPVPFADDSSAAVKDYAYSTLRTYRYEYPRLRLHFDWGENASMLAMLKVEIGDLIAYKNTGLGTARSYVNDWWYVESIQHAVQVIGPPQSVVTLIPSYLYRDLDNVVWDEFTRANVVGDLATSGSRDTWANDAGFDINTNAARPNAVALQLPTLGAVGANVVVEVSLSNLSGDTVEECGVILRYADTSNYARCYVDDGSDQVILEKVVAGVVTVLASPAWTPTNTAELRVIAQGRRYRVWLDRKLVIDTEDADLSANTTVGLMSRSTTVVLFDDFYVQKL